MHCTPSKQKLIANIHPNQNIVLYRVLSQWILANVLKVTKIRRALQFDKKPYMKTFIYTIVKKYFEAKTKVEKEAFKFILNSTFGKTCESMHHRNRCFVVTDPKERALIIANRNFTLFTVIDSNTVLLNRKKKCNFK